LPGPVASREFCRIWGVERAALRLRSVLNDYQGGGEAFRASTEDESSADRIVTPPRASGDAQRPVARAR